MTDKFTINNADIYIGRFTAEEEALGQSTAQQLAVKRLLREAIGYETDVEHRADGSPLLRACDRELSISHCKGYAAIALYDGHRPGIDIERPRPTLRRVATKFLSTDEQILYRTDEELLRAWTIKEALYKAAGVPGISLADGLMLPRPENPDTAHIKRDGRAVPYKISSLPYDDCIFSIALPAE